MSELIVWTGYLGNWIGSSPSPTFLLFHKNMPPPNCPELSKPVPSPWKWRKLSMCTTLVKINMMHKLYEGFNRFKLKINSSIFWHKTSNIILYKQCKKFNFWSCSVNHVHSFYSFQFINNYYCSVFNHPATLSLNYQNLI